MANIKIFKLLLVAVILISVGFLINYFSALKPTPASLRLPPTPTGQTYYVNNSITCSDNGAGTQTQPWCSINKAIKTLQAGDTAYVNPGTYDIASSMGSEANYTVQGLDRVVHAVVRPQNSGTQTSPIRLIANSTAANIIGQGNSPAAQDESNQVYVTNGVIYIDNNKNYWDVEGFYFKRGGGVASDFNTGFTLKDSLIRVHPYKDFSIAAAFDGGYPFGMKGPNNAMLDHLEMWTLMREYTPIDPRGCLPDYIYYGSNGTYPGGVGGVNSGTNVTLRNSFIYANRNSFVFVNSSGILQEGNHNFFVGHSLGAERNVTNFVIRNNVVSFYSNDGTFIAASCGSQGGPGVINNNLYIDVGGPLIETKDNNCPQSAWSSITLRNNLLIKPYAANISFSNWIPDVGVADSDYNMVIYRAPGSDPEEYWRIVGTKPLARWNLSGWQTQTQYPQIKQDPNSYLYGPSQDPGFATPLQDLGQVEGFGGNCNQVFPEVCVAGYVSNCTAPFRMRLLDNFTITSPNSILLGTGDPAYGNGNIGPFGYSGTIPVPANLNVTPTSNLTSAGFVGGPFTPSSFIYTLSNTGTEGMNWSATIAQGWLTLSSSNGVIPANSSQNITASINSSANSLNIGTYSNTTTFTNLTNGQGNTTRNITLAVKKRARAIPIMDQEPRGDNFIKSFFKRILKSFER